MENLPPKPTPKKLDFDINENNKLLCFNFIAIIPPISFFEPGEKFQVKIRGTHFCYVEVIQNKQLTWNQLIDGGYHYLEAGLGEKEYYEYLCKKFAGKKWFRHKESIFNLIFFKKIVQLKLFEDNDIYSSD